MNLFSSDRNGLVANRSPFGKSARSRRLVRILLAACVAPLLTAPLTHARSAPRKSNPPRRSTPRHKPKAPAVKPRLVDPIQVVSWPPSAIVRRNNKPLKIGNAPPPFKAGDLIVNESNTVLDLRVGRYAYLRLQSRGAVTVVALSQLSGRQKHPGNTRLKVEVGPVLVHITAPPRDHLFILDTRVQTLVVRKPQTRLSIESGRDWSQIYVHSGLATALKPGHQPTMRNLGAGGGETQLPAGTVTDMGSSGAAQRKADDSTRGMAEELRQLP